MTSDNSTSAAVVFSGLVVETEADEYAFLWKWRKYLLLLATLVASVTYVAGLNPPGGVWPDGKLAGNPVLPDTYSRRYMVFYYCNATAFVASLVVIILLLKEDVSGSRIGLAVLRSAMVLDLLGLMGAYAAESCRELLQSIYVVVSLVAIVMYVALHICVATSKIPLVEWLKAFVHNRKAKLNELLTEQASEVNNDDLKERRKLLLLLATFATALTYGAGLAPPGGFWQETKDEPGGHRAGDLVLQDKYSARSQAFFFCNTTAFVASLVIIMLLMTRTLSENIIKSYALQVCVKVELLGLMGAFAAGSCRKADTTIYIICLVGAVLAYTVLHTVIGIFAIRLRESPATPNTQVVVPETGVESKGDMLEQSRDLLLLLATLATTITYQAGLNPPGGFWPDDRDGHHAGHPILLDTDTRRYKVFFYCNATAFVASLVIIVIVQSKHLNSGPVKLRALQATMILDLFTLMGAYAAGSCRNKVTTIYVCTLAIAVFAYVAGHVVLFTILALANTSGRTFMDDGLKKLLKTLHLLPGETAPDLDRKRKLLLQLAILAATITYQAGLTPPGGFWSDNNDGHHAGHPVLLNQYPLRYQAFFYCNATGFMASVVDIILLVNQRLYKEGIRCYALHTCIMISLLGVMGAYAAGSCRSVHTSMYVFALVAVVVAFIFLKVLMYVFANDLLAKMIQALRPCLMKLFEPLSSPPTQDNARTNTTQDKQYAKRKCLRLLGILAASVTYQAGLAPPGGLWSEDDDRRRRAMGNPILLDVNQRRYRAFFYCNATSFVASVVVVLLLLHRTLRSHNVSLRAMQSVVILDLLGLLGAYAAGSCRDLQTSVYVLALVVAVLIYIMVHMLLSFDTMVRKAEKLWKCCGPSSENCAPL